MTNKTWWVLVIVIVLGAVLIGKVYFINNQTVSVQTTEQTSQSQMQITSDIFPNNGNIPVAYSCDGAKLQPPLKISGVPAATKSLAMIVDDPDAPMGEFVHWVVWNIDPTTTNIENAKVPSGAVEGNTGLNAPGWVAPCPPSGIHHYNFKLYALDTMLSLPAATNKAGLVAAMGSHIVGSATLVGLYGKGITTQAPVTLPSTGSSVNPKAPAAASSNPPATAAPSGGFQY